MEGLRHWPDHLESSAILEQANFRARGGDFGTIDQRFAAVSGESLMASVPMCRKIPTSHPAKADPDMAYRDPTAWLGREDSNSEMSWQNIPLKGRTDFR